MINVVSISFFAILVVMLKNLKKKLCKKICPRKVDREIVIVYPFNTKTNELFIIQEYIHHYDRKFWKFVSGGIDKEGKSELQHAKEELAEEVGMTAEDICHLHSTEHVFGNRPCYFYVAEDPELMDNPPENPDTDVITETRWVNEAQFQEMLETKELMWDEATMCALQVFRKYNK